MPFFYFVCIAWLTGAVLMGMVVFDIKPDQ
jgi:hypothetical protein